MPLPLDGADVKLFDNLKLAHKILALLVFSGLLSALLVISGGQRLSQINGFYEDITEHAGPARQELVQFSRALNQAGYAAYRTIANVGAAEQARAAANDVGTAFDDAEENLRKATELDPGNRGVYDRLRSASSSLHADMKGVIAAGIGGDSVTATQLMTHLDRRLASVSRKSSTFNLAEQAKVSARVKEALETVDRAIKINYAFGFGGLVCCMGIAFLLATKRIAAPIDRLNTRMRSLSAGDVDTEVFGLNRKDEIGAMAEAVQAFRIAAIEKFGLSRAQQRHGKPWSRSVAATRPPEYARPKARRSSCKPWPRALRSSRRAI